MSTHPKPATNAPEAEPAPELLAFVDALAEFIGELWLQGRLPEPALTNGSQKSDNPSHANPRPKAEGEDGKADERPEGRAADDSTCAA